jgi:hypothetical protein
MIKHLFFLACITVAGGIQAQQAIKMTPELKAGTVIEYDVNAQGQTFPLILKIASIGDEGIVFDYDIAGNMTGKFINSNANLEKGVSLNWDQPVPGEERKLPDDQTIAIMSRAFLADLKKNKTAKYDGIDLSLKEIKKGEEITSGGKEVDALYAESGDGVTKYWILNNDRFPILLKVDGLPSGITLSLKEIRN